MVYCTSNDNTSTQPDTMIKHLESLDESKLNEFIKLNRSKIDESLLESSIHLLTALHWKTISRYVMLSESLLEKYRKNINWKIAFKFQQFSIHFLENKKYRGKPAWKSILTNKKLDEELIEKYWLLGKMPEKFKSDKDWPIFKSRQFSQSFIIRHPEKIPTFIFTQRLWEEYITHNYWLIIAHLSRQTSLPDFQRLYYDWNQFKKKQNHIPQSFFDQITYRCREDAYKKLDQETIERLGTDKFDWLCVSLYTPLNSNFIDKFKLHLLTVRNPAYAHIPSHIVDDRMKFIKEAFNQEKALSFEFDSNENDLLTLSKIHNFLNQCYNESLYKIAINLYKKVEKIAHLDPGIHYTMALIFANTGHTIQALDSFNRCVTSGYLPMEQVLNDDVFLKLQGDSFKVV